jgi:hypothetical protein
VALFVERIQAAAGEYQLSARSVQIVDGIGQEAG